MKRIITIMLAALMAVSAIAATAKPEKVTFLTNLRCNNCVKKVNENIAFEKGVKDLTVSLDKQTITVTYDPAKTSPETLAKAIEKLGYKAQKDTVNTAKQVK